MSKPTGLIPIFGCDNSTWAGDVIFVHGLGGNARGTWHPQEKDDDNNFWLNWLGEELTDVGIWSFGYEAEPFAWKGKAMPLFDQASNLLDWLENRDLGERPLIFVTHSMGGLLVKEMLRTAQNFKKQEILDQTKGIVFLATPHTGANLAKLIDKIGTLTRTNVNVEELKAHAPQLRQLNEWYRENVDDLGIATKVYYETQPVFGILVVDQDSANPGIKGVKPVGIPDDHISIVKPESTDSQIYLGVRKFIKKNLTHLPAIQLKQKDRLIEKVMNDNRKIEERKERINYLQSNKIATQVEIPTIELPPINPPNYSTPISPLPRWDSSQEQPYPSDELLPKTLSQEPKANYDKLNNFLKAKQWKDANQETMRVMLELANRQKDDWLRSKEFKELPCPDLKKIDQLWSDYSEGRFGFSKPRQIWLEIGGKPGQFKGETFYKFGDRVGWRINDEWLETYDQFTFGLQAAEGHLPVLIFSKDVDFSRWKDSFRYFLDCWETCFSN